MRGSEYHILHFIGHGGFDRETQEGILVLCDEAGKGRLVAAQRLGTILRDHRSLRVVVLNACEGARATRADPFAGVAQTLVQQGVPAVIAMQFEITDQAAITFASEFYTAVADGYPVDAALSEARIGIHSDDNDIEWGTPVLYLRAPDGHLFSVNREAARRAEEEQQRVEEHTEWAEAGQRVQEQEEELRGAHVFVSYSHQDLRWLNRLRTMLKPVERRFPAAVWSDRQIEAGARWASEIEQALASARVVLLLVEVRLFSRLISLIRMNSAQC